MKEYIMPETAEIDGETYINLKDLISIIETHKDHVKTGGVGDAYYQLAHDHIIELISIYKDQ